MNEPAIRYTRQIFGQDIWVRVYPSRSTSFEVGQEVLPRKLTISDDHRIKVFESFLGQHGDMKPPTNCGNSPLPQYVCDFVGSGNSLCQGRYRNEVRLNRLGIEPHAGIFVIQGDPVVVRRVPRQVRECKGVKHTNAG